MNPKWELVFDTVVRWLPYIGIIILIPIAVFLVRCISKGACRNGPIVKMDMDEEYWMGDLTMLDAKKLNLESLNKHKSLPNLHDSCNSDDIFRSVSLTRQSSNLQLHDQEIDRGICLICNTVYMENEVAKNLLCSHFFHQKCADDWFSKRGHCPQCIRPSSVSIMNG